MSYTPEEVQKIIAAVGGKENVQTASHCVTRLRLVLKDDTLVDEAALDEIDVVKGSFSANGQFQVIIGTGTVEKVFATFAELTGVDKETTKADVKHASAKKQNWLQRALLGLADIFVPILPAIITAGLLLGINNLLTGPDIFMKQPIIEAYPQWAGVADMINIIASTAFAFLPVLVGWSASKKFGGNPLLGIVLGLVLVNPSLLNAYGLADARLAGEVPHWNLFGWEIEKVGYQAQVLPILAATYVLVKIELFLKKHIKEAFHLLLVAPIALLVTGILSFIIIGPVTMFIAGLITDGIVNIFNVAPGLGGFIYGLLYAPLVITGMHHLFLAVDLQLIGSTGSTFLWPILVMSNLAQGAATLAMVFVFKRQKDKSLAGTAALTASLGVTEPALFGVNLRYRYPFYAAIIGAGLAGCIITIAKVKAFSIGVGGLPGIVSIMKPGWAIFALGMLLAIVIPFVLTLVFSKFQRGK
ncbi:PTS system trehalose-specific EIIBC component [Brochothrix campestris]|uniref:PTS system trehalose-specific transporter subunits IIBC n=1 Tax=Brochothrix campestris FSL F6-1037 TaxID=1265861 RepID=W7CSW7_9LIST|nr:PTS system trehalose-specific EIIBC component [Brochothrix campestris]EUJ39992.1 PTS system trehalose-specific transporter subunits IIBC [Brochothrix campestris FSL F6-1037]